MCFSYVYKFKDGLYTVYINNSESFSGTGVAISADCVVTGVQNTYQDNYYIRTSGGNSINAKVIGQYMGLKFLKTPDITTNGVEFDTVTLQVGDFVSIAHTADSGLV